MEFISRHPKGRVPYNKIAVPANTNPSLTLFFFPNCWDDCQWLASFLMMSPELLGRLVDEHAAALVLYARQWSLNPEDIVQEAFLKLVALKKQPDNLVAWLYRVVRNEAISAYRAGQRRRHYESTMAGQVPTWFVPSENSQLDVDAATARLQELPIDQREVIVAHLWGGLTFGQIGDLTGTSASSAHRCYAAGLASLRRRLGVPCPKPFPTQK